MCLTLTQLPYTHPSNPQFQKNHHSHLAGEETKASRNTWVAQGQYVAEAEMKPRSDGFQSQGFCYF